MLSSIPEIKVEEFLPGLKAYRSDDYEKYSEYDGISIDEETKTIYYYDWSVRYLIDRFAENKIVYYNSDGTIDLQIAEVKIDDSTGKLEQVVVSPKTLSDKQPNILDPDTDLAFSTTITGRAYEPALVEGRQATTITTVTEPVPVSEESEELESRLSQLETRLRQIETEENWLYPLDAQYDEIVCYYGPDQWSSGFHRGIDITDPEIDGANIYAAKSGVVVEAVTKPEYKDGYDPGCYIRIAHADGISTFYAHCSEVYVEEGQEVKQGDIIGAVGSTGMSTGPHLHFEIRLDGMAQNPLDYIAIPQ